MKKKIVWEKWKDPLLSNYDETEWPGYDLDENDDKIPLHTAERQPVIHTPFGMVSVVGDAMAFNAFDFWIMHTNFNLTEGIANAIEQTNGVETMEICTRYRARIGFPRSGLFQPRDVMHAIEQAIYDMDHEIQNQLFVGLETQVVHRAMATRDKVEKKFEYWAMWIVPNGNIEVLGTDTMDEQYRQKFNTLKQAHVSVGGRFLTSESE